MITPDQKPKHKLHENSSLIKALLEHINPRGTFNIVPYLRMKVNPMLASSSIIFLVPSTRC